MIEIVFYTLGCLALVCHLVEKIVEYILDYKDIKRALRIRKINTNRS